MTFRKHAQIRLLRAASCHCKDGLQVPCSTCSAALQHPRLEPLSSPSQSHGTLHVRHVPVRHVVTNMQGELSSAHMIV